jgi:PAS domain S-box-containing protein
MAPVAVGFIATIAIRNFKQLFNGGARLPKACAIVLTLRFPKAEAKRLGQPCVHRLQLVGVSDQVSLPTQRRGSRVGPSSLFGGKEKGSLSPSPLGEISLAYLPPTSRQTRSALVGAAVLLLGLVVLTPFAARPLPQFNGFIPALDATIFVTEIITASLLFAHFSLTRSRALSVLACGYLFSALMVAAHALSFPEAFLPTGNLSTSVRFNFRIYLLWHLGLPVAVFAYVWLRDSNGEGAVVRAPVGLAAICSVAGVLALVSGAIWLAAMEDVFAPPSVSPLFYPSAPWLINLTMLICASALLVLWAFRRSVLDQWLMVVLLASMLELAITGRLGWVRPIMESPGFGSRFTVGFYAGRVLFSLTTSTVVLTALLAETARLYAGVARANMLAGIVNAAQALTSEVELPNLIKRLMTIVLENAGANRGLLILPAGDEYLIRAEARATGDHVDVVMSEKPITRSTCPESLVRYVIRTRESVILDDASKPNLFSADDYLRSSKSLLCIPLIKNQELTGILLLEDTLTSHPFTQARIVVLELLAAQAAISLENTRLYSDLQEREAKVRRLVDSNIIGICIFDLDRRILEANDAFLGIVGHSREDVIAGRLSFAGLTPPEWAEADKRQLAQLTSTGTWRPSEKEFFRKGGSRVPVLVGGATFDALHHQGVAFVVDLTERKRAESELAHANRVATMGQLTASIAHEVNQPIGATLMNAGAARRWLAAQSPNLEAARQAIDRIIDDGKRAGDILSRIRDFSKKAGQKEEVEINEAILEIMRLTRAAVSDHGVVVKTQLSKGLPRILGDRVQLQQVILNLIMNAIEAMGEVSEGSRELLVSTSQAESGVVLVAVSDTGPGLSQASVERVFEAFYTTKSSGLGMGLSICRSIVEAHGGRLWASPNQPRGAVFCMTLPIGKQSIESLEPSSASFDRARLGRQPGVRGR